MARPGTTDSIIAAEQWLSSLDCNVRPACRIRDGLKYTPETHQPIGHSIPWRGGPGRIVKNCRCVAVPITRTWRELGIDAPEVPVGERWSITGMVPADWSYADWIWHASPAAKEHVLGITRSILMSRAGMHMRAMHDERGRYLTVSELRGKYPFAFKLAGI